MGLLNSTVVVVTGAGAGIGRAVSRLFAAEGARLVLNDLGTDIDGKGHSPGVVTPLVEELRATGAAVREHTSDISTSSGAESLIGTALEEYSRVDVLVNCAGIIRENALLNLRDKDLVAVLDVQVIGTFRCMQAAAIAMRQQGGGRIINSTSTTALTGHSGQSANSAAAAAIISLTRTAAVELLRQNIYVNAVAPLAKTRQTEHLPLFHKATTMTPEHVALAYLYLASEASGDLAGEVLSVAGNRVTTLRICESEAVYASSPDGLLTLEELREASHKPTAVD